MNRFFVVAVNSQLISWYFPFSPILYAPLKCCCNLRLQMSITSHAISSMQYAINLVRIAYEIVVAPTTTQSIYVSVLWIFFFALNGNENIRSFFSRMNNSADVFDHTRTTCVNYTLLPLQDIGPMTPCHFLEESILSENCVKQLVESFRQFLCREKWDRRLGRRKCTWRKRCCIFTDERLVRGNIKQRRTTSMRKNAGRTAI